VPHDLLVHVTWTVQDRAPFVTAAAAEHLVGLLPVLAGKGGGDLLECAVLPTHVHCVVATGPVTALPRLVQYLKGGSSRLVNQAMGGACIRWAAGYDARTIGRIALPSLRAYLDRQAEHHRMALLARWSKPATALQGLPVPSPGFSP
jgi:putative transposase